MSHRWLTCNLVAQIPSVHLVQLNKSEKVVALVEFSLGDAHSMEISDEKPGQEVEMVMQQHVDVLGIHGIPYVDPMWEEHLNQLSSPSIINIGD